MISKPIISFATFVPVAIVLFVGIHALPKLEQIPKPTSRAQEIINDNIHQLEFVGQIGNKLYFKNDNQMNWRDALDLCKNSSMTLAEFGIGVDREEYQFVVEKLSNDLNHWAGARIFSSSRSPLTAFAWNHANFTLDLSPFLPLDPPSPEYWICTGIDYNRVHTINCDFQKKVLCQVTI